MRTFDEQAIVSIAPNANAVTNGRKLSSGNSFVKKMTAYILESAREAERAIISFP